MHESNVVMAEGGIMHEPKVNARAKSEYIICSRPLLHCLSALTL